MRRHGDFLCLLCALFLLLILSALVETPADREGAVPVSKHSPALLSVALLPNTLPSQGEDASRLVAPFFMAVAVLAGLFAWAGVLAAAVCRDANGRWIRGRRYVDSVYQVFRQEAAAG